ncbi:MAG TPA: patatin-like phospholipase family protein [Pyrinomonadaceae bacterium]|nr:patatin-like phospholipase family protein [Pyrinomonadaceae bacterium]
MTTPPSSPESTSTGTQASESTSNVQASLQTGARPFGDIALSLSGGGYRAAAFHLGVLDLLNELRLLKGVTLLSTVSGGTITGAKYVLDELSGTDYETFRVQMRDFLRDVDVVRESTNNLYNEAGALQGRALSLIRTAAQVYADKLVGDTRFSKILADGERFKELTFNATEFRTGVAFRFLASRSSDARFGNGNLWVHQNVIPHIRVADVIAASSCFPGAFEPIIFPDDFCWRSANALTLDEVRRLLHENFSQGVPLMDGGIYDNQGFSSLELAGDRLTTEIGLIIISDTNQRSEPLYVSPTQTRRGWLSLGSWRFAGIGVAVLSLATWIALIIQFFRQVAAARTSPVRFITGDPLGFLLLYLIPFILALSVFLLLLRLGSLMRRKRHLSISGQSFDIWAIAKRLTIPDLIDLLETRFGSLFAMASSVFLKRVRALLLNSAARDEDYRNKLMFNVLYEMNLPHPSLYKKAPWLRPLKFLTDSATAAERVDTNLWSTDVKQLDNLITCGRATTCFNLLWFLIDKRSIQLDDPNSAESELFKRAKAIWDGFNKS